MIAARTPAEAALVAAHEAATGDRTQRALTFRPNPRKPGAIEPDTEDLRLWAARLAETLGVGDASAQLHLLMQAAAVFWRGDEAGNANAAVALIRELGPTAGTEAMLAVQMVAVHNTALEQLRRAMLPDQPSQVVDSVTNRATRLLRLFADQASALERLREHRPRASAAPLEVVRRIVFVAPDGWETNYPMLEAGDGHARFDADENE